MMERANNNNKDSFLITSDLIFRCEESQGEGGEMVAQRVSEIIRKIIIRQFYDLAASMMFYSNQIIDFNHNYDWNYHLFPLLTSLTTNFLFSV